MIGLAEDASRYDARGYTPGRQARRLPAVPAARHAVRHAAARAQHRHRAAPAARWSRRGCSIRRASCEVFRALQLARFTTTAAVRHRRGDPRGARARATGSTPTRCSPRSTTRRSRRPTRPIARWCAPPPGSPTEFQGKAANTDGAVRYTAPSLVFEPRGRAPAGGGRLPAGRGLRRRASPTSTRRWTRRPPAEDAVEVARGVPLSADHARGRGRDGRAPRRRRTTRAAEAALIAAAADGCVRRETRRRRRPVAPADRVADRRTARSVARSQRRARAGSPTAPRDRSSLAAQRPLGRVLDASSGRAARPGSARRRARPATSRRPSWRRRCRCSSSARGPRS